jgi:hypothetical protein
LRTSYPSKTANIYGSNEQVEAAIKLWATHLHGVEDEYVIRALREMVDKFSWAPDVAEFKQLCMSYKGSSKTPWAEEVLKFEKPKNSKVSNLEVRAIIDEGSEICKRLKKIYPEKSWMAIAGVFTLLKNKARVYHPGLGDIKLIRELMKYSHQDVIDALG